MRCEDTIEIHAKKSDGTTYRYWTAVVEAREPDCLITLNRVGDQVNGPAGGWCMKHAMRTIYWFDHPYNLAEMYQPDGALKQIYIHIASPAVIHDGTLSYTDYELDVVKRPGQPLRIVDEDEFDAARGAYGYSTEFCGACRQAVSEAIELADRWTVLGPPWGDKRRAARPRRRYRGSSSTTRTAVPVTDSSTRSTEV